MAFHDLSLMLPLILVWLFSKSSSSAVTFQIRMSEDVAGTLCKETLNPELCKTTLENFTRSKEANMQELGITAVLLATEQARFNKKILNHLLQKENHAMTKNNLLSCLDDYKVTLGKLRNAYKLADRKDYKGMVKLVNDATKMTKKCDDRVEETGPRSPLKDNNLKLIWLNDVTLITIEALMYLLGD